MPKVSVIVPVYNVERLLARCLDSLLDQTTDDYEIICVNDCTPDKSQDILDEYASRYPDKIIQVKNEKNVGQGMARNNGLNFARGEYVIYIDSDDYVKNDYIETYLNAIEKHKCDVVIGGFINDVEGKFSTVEYADDFWRLLNYPSAWAKIYRADLLKGNSIFFANTKYAEDAYFSLCLYYNDPKCHVIDYNGYYYCFNKTSAMSTAKYREPEKDVSRIFDEFLSKHDISKLSDDRKAVIEYQYIAVMLSNLIIKGRGCGVKRMKARYDFFLEDLKKKFPDYKKNPYLGISRKKTKGQTKRFRYGVGVTMALHRIKLDKLLYYVISLL